MNHKLLVVQAEFRKGRGTGNQIAGIHWIIEQARVPEKHLLCFLNDARAFDSVNHNNCGKFLKRWEYQRNLYAFQEATFRTRHGTIDWLKTGKGVREDCILSPCLFSLYAEHII